MQFTTVDKSLLQRITQLEQRERDMLAEIRRLQRLLASQQHPTEAKGDAAGTL